MPFAPQASGQPYSQNDIREPSSSGSTPGPPVAGYSQAGSSEFSQSKPYPGYEGGSTYSYSQGYDQTYQASSSSVNYQQYPPPHSSESSTSTAPVSTVSVSSSGGPSHTPTFAPTSSHPSQYPPSSATPTTYTTTNSVQADFKPAPTPKRLHVSNIPFRFREPDLRQLFYVS